MAEESEIQDAGESTGGGIDPAAMVLSLTGASRAKADAFLDEQRRLIEARQQLAIAARLDLSSADKTELARANHG